MRHFLDYLVLASDHVILSSSWFLLQRKTNKLPRNFVHDNCPLSCFIWPGNHTTSCWRKPQHCLPSVIELPWVHAGFMALLRQIFKAVLLLVLAMQLKLLAEAWEPHELNETFAILLYVTVFLFWVIFASSAVPPAPSPAPAPISAPAVLRTAPMLTANVHVPPGVHLKASQIPLEIFQGLLPPAPPPPLVAAIPAPLPAVPGNPWQSICQHLKVQTTWQWHP